ncbi:AAA family ATPase [Georgenia thermotolerans]|uniref:AAA family ATPase n=1 Tax=Georgenia thermotolerans TaxID=527326 RepID=A0A7J5UM44_9MICO|nr:AAA family ATPase [Georgenia thermotolerans]KAE8763447.1 AAA family ATPase [Georgenia thermotolerans]
MSHVVLATASPELAATVAAATGGAYVALPQLPTTPGEVLAVAGGLPEAVVLDARTAPDQVLDVAAGLTAISPGIGIILVSDCPAEVGLAAMRAGVRDILTPAADATEMRDALGRAAQLARPQTPPAGLPLTTDAGAEGKVITVVSPKGGVGKTTVATNLAVGLARTVPHSTVLVDLDLQFGDVASALNLDPEYSLADAVHNPARRDTMVLKTFLTLHETGLYVLCAPESPAAADGISGDDVGRLLQALASQFRYVVVDTAPGLNEHTLSALDQTTDPVLLTSMDVPGVRGLRKELDTLTDLGMFAEGRFVLLNFEDPANGLSIADVEATIARAVDLTLPRCPAVPASVNQGVPLLQVGGKNSMTRQLGRLVERFAGVPTLVAKPGRRRGRHRGVKVGA